MAGGGGGSSGGGGSGGSGGGYGGGNAAAGGYGFAGMGGMAGGASQHGGAGEFIGWRDPLGRIYPWEIEPNDPYGIPKEFAGYELVGNNLVDTRGYFNPYMAGGPGVDYSRNSAPISAMIPNARGGEMLDPRFVGMDKRNEGQAAGISPRDLIVQQLMQRGV